MVVLGTVIRETIGAMREAKKLGWDVNVPRRHADQRAGSAGARQGERWKACMPRRGFEMPYEDTAKGKVKDWLANYKKMFGTDANTQAIIGYNTVMTFAHYAKKAGKDLTGQKLLDALESATVSRTSSIRRRPSSRRPTISPSTVTQVQQIKKGRWVLVKDGLMF